MKKLITITILLLSIFGLTFCFAGETKKDSAESFSMLPYPHLGFNTTIPTNSCTTGTRLSRAVIRTGWNTSQVPQTSMNCNTWYSFWNFIDDGVPITGANLFGITPIVINSNTVSSTYSITCPTCLVQGTNTYTNNTTFNINGSFTASVPTDGISFGTASLGVSSSGLSFAGDAISLNDNGSGVYTFWNSAPGSLPAHRGILNFSGLIGGSSFARTYTFQNASGTLAFLSDIVPSWSLSGNSGTSAGTNFVGTTDAVDLIFKTNSTERLKITSSGLLVGTNAGIQLTSSGGADAIFAALSGSDLRLRTGGGNYLLLATDAGTLTENITGTCTRTSTSTMIDNSVGRRFIMTGGSDFIITSSTADWIWTANTNKYIFNMQGSSGNISETIAGTESRTITGASTETSTARKKFTTGLFSLTGIPAYSDNATAIAGGLVAGDLYYTDTAGEYILKIAH